MAKKYIDPDTLDGWEIELSRTTDRGHETITTTAKELAEVLPTADVVEVVRCRECRYRENEQQCKHIKFCQAVIAAYRRAEKEKKNDNK